jgi:crossover junction endodeoxyribonuclease RuvC
MILMGVDPGLASTGVGVIRLVGREWQYVHAEHILTAPSAPLSKRLDAVHQLVARMIREHQPAALSIESIFFAKNVRSAVLMAHGRGVAILAASQSNIPVEEFSPLEIKQSVIGKGRATKEQVKQMVTAILRMETPPSTDHAADALAAALCLAYRRLSPLAQQTQTARTEAGEELLNARRALLSRMRTSSRRRRS